MADSTSNPAKQPQTDDPVPTESDHLILDVKGDVRIQCGIYGFLVSSRVLSLASPVFEALFESGFKESTQERSWSNPLLLPLPDDDPIGLNILLRILHYFKLSAYRRLDLKEILRTAQVADKYNCADALMFCSEIWLAQLQPTLVTTSQYLEYCRASHWLNYPRGVCHSIFKLSFLMDEDDILNEFHGAGLPKAFTGLAHRFRMEILKSIAAHINELLEKLMQTDRDFRINHPYDTCRLFTRLRSARAVLSKAGVWPLSELMDGSIPLVHQAMSETFQHNCDSSCTLKADLEVFTKNMKALTDKMPPQLEQIDIKLYE